MTPNIRLVWCDVKITSYDRGPGAHTPRSRKILQFVEEIQLVQKLVILGNVGNVAACRNIQIVNDERFLVQRSYAGTDMARVPLLQKSLLSTSLKGSRETIATPW